MQQSGLTFKPPAYYCVGPAKTVLIHQDIFTHQAHQVVAYIHSHFCLSKTFQRCPNGFGQFGGQVNNINSLIFLKPHLKPEECFGRAHHPTERSHCHQAILLPWRSEFDLWKCFSRRTLLRPSNSPLLPCLLSIVHSSAISLPAKPQSIHIIQKSVICETKPPSFLRSLFSCFYHIISRTDYSLAAQYQYQLQ